MTEPLVLLEFEGETALMTINRPEKRNALSRATLQEIWDALDRLHATETKVVIVTGAGDVSFCAGADLKDTSPELRVTYTDFIPWIRTNRLIQQHPSVFIAAVNGYALGGGLTLVNNCDLAIGAQSSSYGAPEITFGYYAGLAGPSTVRRLLPKHAAELILKGNRVDAETAFRWGLINEVVPDDQLLVRTRELAAEIAAWDATALDVARNAMRAEQTMPWGEALDHGVRSGVLIRHMQDVNARWRESR